jgi:hypothetical protein
MEKEKKKEQVSGKGERKDGKLVSCRRAKTRSYNNNINNISFISDLVTEHILPFTTRIVNSKGLVILLRLEFYFGFVLAGSEQHSQDTVRTRHRAFSKT